MKRRDFLKGLAGLFAGASGIGAIAAQAEQTSWVNVDSSEMQAQTTRSSMGYTFDEPITIKVNEALRSGQVVYIAENGVAYPCTVDDRPIGVALDNHTTLVNGQIKGVVIK